MHSALSRHNCMCGIVGYVGKKDAKEVLLGGLRRLEYRGYDSAGMALVLKRKESVSKSLKKIFVLKEVGKVSQLEAKASTVRFSSSVGIAHTRWATHGKPSKNNAHPHSDCTETISVVHNGIIENYRELREKLEASGHVFRSETDSEVIPHLIEEHAKTMPFEEALYVTLGKLKGTYAVVAVSAAEPEKIFAARLSSPMVLGVGNGEYILASDASAIIEYTNTVVYLDDCEVAVISADGYSIHSLSRKRKKKSEVCLEWSLDQAKKQGFDHFMLKEIFEQPNAIEDAMRGRYILEDGMARLGGLRSVESKLKRIQRCVIVSCGTSYFSGLIGEYMLEEYAGIPVEVEYASEFRYRKPILDDRTMVLCISQSGETADTLAALREAKNKGALTLGMVNVVGSSIARETDAGVYNHAGPEVSVASTKAFTSQVVLLALLTVFLGRQRNMSLTTGRRILKELIEIPAKIQKILDQKNRIRSVAKKYAHYENFLYLGRKYNSPIAFEGALKIKEIAYVHAEGYPAGEMKHGPIALIQEKFPVIAIVPDDSVSDKMMSGLEEVKARGAKVFAITTENMPNIEKIADDVFFIPKTLEMLTPLLSVVPLQMFAYFVAVHRGFDVDRPRNLAKSVTVE